MSYFYTLLFVCCVLEAVFQTHHRGCQSWIQVIFVALFMGFGWAYVCIQALLIIVSLLKIGTGTVGGWAVTARKAQKPPTQAEAPSAVDEEAPAPCAQKGESDFDTVRDESTSEGSMGTSSEEYSGSDEIFWEKGGSVAQQETIARVPCHGEMGQSKGDLSVTAGRRE